MKQSTQQHEDEIEQALDNIEAIFHQYEQLVEKADQNNMEDKDTEFFLSEAFQLGAKEVRLWQKIGNIKSQLTEEQEMEVENRLDEVIH